MVIWMPALVHDYYSINSASWMHFKLLNTTDAIHGPCYVSHKIQSNTIRSQVLYCGINPGVTNCFVSHFSVEIYKNVVHLLFHGRQLLMSPNTSFVYI